MRPIRLPALSSAQLEELDHCYRTAREGRLRIRALMILLATERGMVAAEIAAVVRQDEETVRRWLLRYEAEGLAGLADAPRAGAPPKVTDAYREQRLAVVRRRPRALDLPFSLWTGQRLADYLAEQTGLRISRETVYRLLRAGGVHLSRPHHTITSPDPEYALNRRRWSPPRATS